MKARSATHTPKRFCWRCLAFALGPFAVLLGLGWVIVSQVEAGRMASVDANSVNSALRDEVSGLRTRLADAEDALARARVNAPGSGVGAGSLVARVQALPAAERAALATAVGFEGGAPMMTAAEQIAGMDATERAALFSGLPSDPQFLAWFEDLDAEARADWLAPLPGMAAIFNAVSAGEDPATRYETMRTERDLALAQRDALRDERDLARLQLESAATERDAAREEAVRAAESARATLETQARERDAALALRDEAVAERDTLALTLEEMVETRAADQREIDRLAGSVARLEAEMARMRAELAEAERRLVRATEDRSIPPGPAPSPVE